MIRPALVGSLLVALFGCNRSNLVYDKPYFDFDSLVSVQIKLLGQEKDSIKKTAVMDGKTDVSQFVVDTASMSNEMEVFRQLDIMNKPLFKDAYQLHADEKDDKSNLRVRTYRLKTNADIKSAVPFVRFFYLDDFQQVKKIQSVFEESNSLYSTHRDLIMEFDGAGESARLRRYLISGFQKMTLSDSVKFSIEGRVY